MTCIRLYSVFIQIIIVKSKQLALLYKWAITHWTCIAHRSTLQALISSRNMSYLFVLQLSRYCSSTEVYRIYDRGSLWLWVIERHGKVHACARAHTHTQLFITNLKLLAWIYVMYFRKIYIILLRQSRLCYVCFSNTSRKLINTAHTNV